MRWLSDLKPASTLRPVRWRAFALSDGRGVVSVDGDDVCNELPIAIHVEGHSSGRRFRIRATADTLDHDASWERARAILEEFESGAFFVPEEVRSGGARWTEDPSATGELRWAEAAD